MNCNGLWPRNFGRCANGFVCIGMKMGILALGGDGNKPSFLYYKLRASFGAKPSNTMANKSCVARTCGKAAWN